MAEQRLLSQVQSLERRPPRGRMSRYTRRDIASNGRLLLATHQELNSGDALLWRV